MRIDPERLRDLGARYTEAWCSREPGRVAAFFSEHGSLSINGGEPAVGREAIGTVAAGFMTTFPDLVLTMDDVHADGERAVYRWTFTGTHGDRRPVRFSGSEEWEIGMDGLIASSLGHFDEADYLRQLSG
jgi:nuclear transport factor 2 (NTF2) superfamily protein